MSLTFLLTVASFASFLYLSDAHAAAVQSMSAGIKRQSYTIEWCAAHHSELVDA